MQPQFNELIVALDFRAVAIALARAGRPSDIGSLRIAAVSRLQVSYGLLHENVFAAKSGCGSEVVRRARELCLPHCSLPDHADRVGPDLPVTGHQRQSLRHSLCNQYPVKGIPVQIRKRRQG